MHTVIVAQFVTLDGVTEDPDGSGGTDVGGWAFRHGPDAVAGDKFRFDEIMETGVALLGRRSWELLGSLFAPRDDAFSLRLNAMRKLVASRSTAPVDAWSNSTPLRGELVDEVLRRRAVQDVVVIGSASVVEHLVAADLVDQYRLLVFPLVVGKGRRLFDGLGAPADLALRLSEDAGGGVLRQVYDRHRA